MPDTKTLLFVLLAFIASYYYFTSTEGGKKFIDEKATKPVTGSARPAGGLPKSARP
jgi:hypothetical protein